VILWISATRTGSVPVYRLIYDARQVPPDLTWSVALLLIAALGLAFWTFGRRDARSWTRMTAGQGVPEETGRALTNPDPLRRARLHRRLGLWVAAAAAAMALLVGWMERTERARFADALDRGEYTLVEGAVFGLERGDRGGHRDERFSVRSGDRVYTYRYSHSRDERGFHESHGPIREGYRVRIADIDGTIARLEIVE
jgi:hypothetical protein